MLKYFIIAGVAFVIIWKIKHKKQKREYQDKTVKQFKRWHK